MDIMVTEAPDHFDELHVRPWAPAHTPFSYVDVAIRQLLKYEDGKGFTK